MKHLLAAALALMSASAFAQNISPDGRWQSIAVIDRGNPTRVVLDRSTILVGKDGFGSARVIAYYSRPVPYGRDLVDRTTYFYSFNCIEGQMRADAVNAQAGATRTVYHANLDGGWITPADGNALVEAVCGKVNW